MPGSSRINKSSCDSTTIQDLTRYFISVIRFVSMNLSPLVPVASIR